MPPTPHGAPDDRVGLVTHLLLVRHGESEWNASGRWQGHADPPLTALGRQQALAAARHVGMVDAIVSSDLTRARETATLIANEIGVGPVIVDSRLRERDAGEWTGLTRHEIEERFPGYLAEHRRPPGFEHDDDILGRVVEALAEVHAHVTGGAVVVVSHGGVVRALERTYGHPEDDRLVPNLGGRWFTIRSTGIAIGERVVLIDHEQVRQTAPQQL